MNQENSDSKLSHVLRAIDAHPIFSALVAFLFALALVALVSLSGCSQEAKVRPDTLEDARAQTRLNAESNAAIYRSNNPRLQGYKIVGHTDAVQTPECPQGSGWASVSFLYVDEATQQISKYTAKCSTVSASIGCYLDKDFSALPYAKEENQCQPTTKVPFPIPKLSK